MKTLQSLIESSYQTLIEKEQADEIAQTLKHEQEKANIQTEWDRFTALTVELLPQAIRECLQSDGAVLKFPNRADGYRVQSLYIHQASLIIDGLAPIAFEVTADSTVKIHSLFGVPSISRPYNLRNCDIDEIEALQVTWDFHNKYGEYKDIFNALGAARKQELCRQSQQIELESEIAALIENRKNKIDSEPSAIAPPLPTENQQAKNLYEAVVAIVKNEISQY